VHIVHTSVFGFKFEPKSSSHIVAIMLGWLNRFRALLNRRNLSDILISSHTYQQVAAARPSRVWVCLAEWTCHLLKHQRTHRKLLPSAQNQTTKCWNTEIL